MISEVNPSELVKCSSENICLVIKFVKCLATSHVGSVINVKIDVNLQDIIPKCLGYLLRHDARSEKHQIMGHVFRGCLCLLNI